MQKLRKSVDEGNGAGRSECLHCGTPVPKGMPEGFEYCCHGCAYVHQMIEREGLDRYYELRDSVIRPIRPGVLEQRDYAWLETAAARAGEANREEASLEFELEGISCIGCVWLIETVFQRFPGGLSIEINPQLGRLRMRWRPGLFPVVDFARELQKFGYWLAPAGRAAYAESSRLTGRIGIAAALGMNGMLFTLPKYLGMEADFQFARLFGWLTFLFATLSLLACGSYFVRRAWLSLRNRVLHMDLPIALGIVLAYGGSVFGWLRGLENFIYFDFVCIFIFLMLVGRWTQERALEYNRNRLANRGRRPHEFVRVAADLQKEETVPLEELVPGNLISVRSGDWVPVASRLISRNASCSLAWINGESRQSVFRDGMWVPSGAVNLGDEPILVEAGERWPDSRLSRLTEDTATQYRNRRLEKILRYYLWVILVIALAGLAGWGWSGDWLTGWQVVLSVLVVSCPCAIGVSLPLADEWALLRLREAGVFVREAGLFGKLRQVRQILFDKTGTLTLDAPELTNPEVFAALSAEDVAVLRWMVRSNLHPVSRAVRQALWAVAEEPHLPVVNVEVSEEIGMGLKAVRAGDDAVWSLGRPEWLAVDDRGNEAGYVCVLRRNGRFVAGFNFAESLRKDAREALDQLRKTFRIYILSGDRRERVQKLAAELGIAPEMALGEQTPEDKAEWVQHNAAGQSLFVGDGANDSLAFRQALVRGTPVSDAGLLEEQADFYFSGQSLKGIQELFRVGHVRRQAARRVFAIAVLYNAVVVSVSLLGHMNPLLAAVLMPLSSLVTIGVVALSFRWRELAKE